jgi:hypothetical protein
VDGLIDVVPTQRVTGVLGQESQQVELRRGKVQHLSVKFGSPSGRVNDQRSDDNRLAARVIFGNPAT